MMEELKGVSEDCLEFLCGRTAINLVPLSGLLMLPRIGDKIDLPGEGPESGAGLYEITDVRHCYVRDYDEKERPCPARLLKIVAEVKLVTATRAMAAGQPARHAQFTPGAIQERVPIVPQPTKQSVSPGNVGHWNHPDKE